MNRHEHLRQLQWNIAWMYKDHQLLGEDYWDEGRGARWLIGKPQSSTMLSEVIAGIGGSLIVHGDCDTSRFAHYGDYKDAWHRLCWMGLCTDVDYYVAEKASIGLRRLRLDEYDEDVAKHDLLAYAGELREEHDESRTELIELLEEAAAVATQDEHNLSEFLGNRDKGWDLWEHGFGKVVATPVVTGHLALQRCCYLLIDKYGMEGPPACRGDRRRG